MSILHARSIRPRLGALIALADRQLATRQIEVVLGVDVHQQRARRAEADHVMASLPDDPFCAIVSIDAAS